MNQDDATPPSTPVHAELGLRKVNAIVRTSVLERVEQRLKALHVPGISVTKVKGYGEYANFFVPEWTTEHARLEIFCKRERADEIARAIVDSAHTGLEGDGIVAVMPVEAIYRVRSRTYASSDELGGHEQADRAPEGTS